MTDQALPRSALSPSLFPHSVVAQLGDFKVPPVPSPQRSLVQQQKGRGNAEPLVPFSTRGLRAVSVLVALQKHRGPLWLQQPPAVCPCFPWQCVHPAGSGLTAS